MTPRQLMLGYYLATAVFLLLDLLADVNVRVAFLERAPALKYSYYAVCFACLALIVWRPAWTAIVSAFESLISLVALILSFGLRTILISDAMLDGTAAIVTIEEVVNFLLAGGIAWLAWVRGLQALQRGS